MGCRFGSLFIIILILGCAHSRLDEVVEKKTKCIHLKNSNDMQTNETETTDAVIKTIESCDPPYLFCYTFWTNDSQGITVKSQGCFSDNKCEGRHLCVGHEIRSNSKSWFCCCEGDFCNDDFHHDPNWAPPSAVVEEEETDDNSAYFTWGIKLPLVCLAIIICVLFITRYRKQCMKQRNNQQMERHLVQPTPTVVETLYPIELIERKAKGRFGAVWKAKMKNDIVAVKIVAAQEKKSWTTEQEILQMPFMEHDNILKYIGAEKHCDNWQTEYWLITAYHEIGSLSDYLRENTVTLEQLCFISFTMARGLDHLHDEIRTEKGDYYKPTIAHRDFKSGNVLIKSDLSACIADFGLALVFKSQTCGVSRAQVGTRRYMAPEVLEGVINFSCSSFLRIDMYACGLVLWEILSRCSTPEKAAEEYRLPFEVDLGEHPSIDALLQHVSVERHRPLLREEWKNNESLSNICTMIEECWDADAEARISAACVMERFLWILRAILNNETKLLYNIL